MTSRGYSQKNGTAINTPDGTDSVAVALRSLANRAKLRLNGWIRASAKFPENPQDTRRCNGSGEPRGKHLSPEGGRHASGWVDSAGRLWRDELRHTCHFRQREFRCRRTVL